MEATGGRTGHRERGSGDLLCKRWDLVADWPSQSRRLAWGPSTGSGFQEGLACIRELLLPGPPDLPSHFGFSPRPLEAVMKDLVPRCHWLVRHGSSLLAKKSCHESVSASVPPGPPAPPQDVAVQAGTTPATVQVSWRPPTLTATGLSNGANVTGYGVYAKGQRVSFYWGGAHIQAPRPPLTIQRGVTLPLSSIPKTH